eukprot:COSAG05_NODE_16670_length_341_cov_0.747934_1_plen_55_part_10
MSSTTHSPQRKQARSVSKSLRARPQSRSLSDGVIGKWRCLDCFMCWNCGQVQCKW